MDVFLREPRRFRELPRTSALGFAVPLARTRRSRLLGLALLARDRAGEGLLIPRCRSVHTFGMRFRLDLIFLAADGRVLELRRSVPSGRIARCRGADAVLELPSPEPGDPSGAEYARPALVIEPRESSRQWWVLVGTCMGMFVPMLDSTVVALALPTIQRDLHASADSLQWVLNVYLLTISVLVVSAGRLGDIAGRRLVFVTGIGLFAAGSVLAALAWDDGVLLLARVVQGIGGAATISLSLAMVSHAFPAERQTQALGIWAAVSALGIAVGPLIGGFLIEVDWRLIFWINLPIAALGIAIILWAAEESRDETSGHRLDYPGLVTLSGGLFALILAMIKADDWGWGSTRTIALLVIGAVALAAFWRIEHRVREPIVDFALFRNGPYLGASAAAFAIIGAYWAVIFYQPQYLQEILGHTVIAAGLLILPMTAPMVIISPFSSLLVGRFGPRSLMTFGMICGAVGIALLTRIDAESGYRDLLPGYLLFGISLGLVYAPMSAAAMLAMPREKVGIAAGVLAMVRVTAGAVILAVVAAVFQGVQADQLEKAPGEVAGAFTDALADSTWVLVGLLVVGAIITWALVRAPRAPEHRPEKLASRIEHRRFHL